MVLEGPIPTNNLAWNQVPHLASMPTLYFPGPSSYPHLGLGKSLLWPVTGVQLLFCRFSKVSLKTS